MGEEEEGRGGKEEDRTPDLEIQPWLGTRKGVFYLKKCIYVYVTEM